MSNHEQSNTINPLPAMMNLLLFVLPIVMLLFMLRSGALLIVGTLIGAAVIGMLMENFQKRKRSS